MKRLVDQFGLDWDKDGAEPGPNTPQITENKATILFIIDTLSKYLIDITDQPVRKVREDLDLLAKSIMDSDPVKVEKALFRFRQYFNSYRIDEYSYIQNTFDDFKNVIWDFADQLTEDAQYEKTQDRELGHSLEKLKDAVEANSIEELRSRSREFIDFYVEVHSHREERRARRMDHMQQNLAEVRGKLSEATKSASIDHLTGAWNRRSFDDRVREVISNFKEDDVPCSMLMLDIDFFKRINDDYGHDVGDFVLQECVRILQEIFSGPGEFVSRIGGEEFTVLLPKFQAQDAVKKAEKALNTFRDEIIVHSDKKIQFTCSIGIAQLLDSEDRDQWVKRADEALYKAKNNGRDRWVLAPNATGVEKVA